MLLALALGLLLYLVADRGYLRLKESNGRIMAAQSRQVQLSGVLRLMLDLETGQRGFLLTGDRHYLVPYQQAEKNIESSLDTLANSYIAAKDADALTRVRSIRTITGAKLMELQATLRLYEQAGARSALELMRTNIGIEELDRIRGHIAALYAAETLVVSKETATGRDDLWTARALMGSATLLNVLLAFLAALLWSREIQRNRTSLAELDDRNRHLDAAVMQRTKELNELSNHLQRVAEIEKSALSRELHDELGGLLIATKMDAMWLQRRLKNQDQDVGMRLERMSKLLEDGVAFKRRVVENLRPTLLDNLGLFPALTWLCEENCGLAGLAHEEHMPEEEPPLSDDARIAVFRIVQEALTNVMKHAQARRVVLTVAVAGEELVVSLQDDGRGMRPNPSGHAAHGLMTMRHRAMSTGGELSVASGPETGTLIRARIPLLRANADAPAGSATASSI
jgi:signal transduction histidine kinase